jgi:adenylate cyclase class IV
MEVEIRAFVNEKTKDIVRKHGILLKRFGPYVDEYYKPAKCSAKEFDPQFITLRARKLNLSKNIVSILFDKVEYLPSDFGLIKISLFGGKIKLFEGDEAIAKEILNSLNFEYWFSIKRLGGEIYQISNKEMGLEFKVALENVDGIGEMIEVEFEVKSLQEGKEKMEKVIAFLGLNKENILNKTLGKFMMEKLSRRNLE